MKDSSDTAGTDNGNRQDEQPGGPDGQMGDVAGSKDGAGMVSGDFSLIGFSSDEAVANASNGSFTMVRARCSAMTRAVMAMPSSPNRSPTVPDNPIARFSWKGPPMTTNSANTANAAIAKEAVETNGAQSQQTDPPTLQLDNVSYAYTKGGKRVLKNISHDFQAGKKCMPSPDRPEQAKPRCYH